MVKQLGKLGSIILLINDNKDNIIKRIFIQLLIKNTKKPGMN